MPLRGRHLAQGETLALLRNEMPVLSFVIREGEPGLLRLLGSQGEQERVGGVRDDGCGLRSVVSGGQKDNS